MGAFIAEISGAILCAVIAVILFNGRDLIRVLIGFAFTVTTVVLLVLGLANVIVGVNIFLLRSVFDA